MGHGRRLVYTGGRFDWGDHGDDWIDETTPEPITDGRRACPPGRLPRRAAPRRRPRRGPSPRGRVGPGGLFAAALVYRARKGRLRCIGRGTNWWSCVHVEDLATAYVIALTRAEPGAVYAIVDEEPLPLRELIDLITDALEQSRVGTARQR